MEIGESIHAWAIPDIHSQFLHMKLNTSNQQTQCLQEVISKYLEKFLDT